MQGLILAAGRGSRMGALTAEVPKGFYPLFGRRLIDWQLGALRAAGIDRIGIVTGYRSEVVEAAVPGWNAALSEPLTLFHNAAWERTNMVATLACAADWLAAGPTIVSYSDIFYTPATVRALAAAAGRDLAISYDPDWLQLWRRRSDNPLADAETFRRDATGRLLEIGARAASVDVIEGQYMGLLRFEPAGAAALFACRDRLPPERRDRIDFTSMLSALIAEDVAIGTVPCQGAWGEVDTPEDAALYEREFDPSALVALGAA